MYTAELRHLRGEIGEQVVGEIISVVCGNARNKGGSNQELQRFGGHHGLARVFPGFPMLVHLGKLWCDKGKNDDSDGGEMVRDCPDISRASVIWFKRTRANGTRSACIAQLLRDGFNEPNQASERTPQGKVCRAPARQLPISDITRADLFE